MPSDLPPRLLSDFNIALHMVLERNVMQQMQYKIGVKASEGKPARDKYIRILIFEDGFVYDPEVNSGLPASN
jgi:hypothetical protein